MRLRRSSGRMTVLLPTVLAVGLAAPELSAQGERTNGFGGVAEAYRSSANRLIEAALRDSSAYERLTLLVDQFGHRLSGSESLEQAIDWIIEEMKRDGLENVRGWRASQCSSSAPKRREAA